MIIIQASGALERLAVVLEQEGGGIQHVAKGKTGRTRRLVEHPRALHAEVSQLVGD